MKTKLLILLSALCFALAPLSCKGQSDTLKNYGLTTIHLGEWFAMPKDWLSLTGNELSIHGDTLSDECEYAVPKGYKIVSNGGITGTFITTSKPALFRSECKAKAYLKAFIDENETPKMTGFK